MNLRFSKLILLVLIASLTACRGSRRAPAPAPVARPSGSPARRAPNPDVFAADGMCADRLARQHAQLESLHERILETLRARELKYKIARARVKHGLYFPNQVRENNAAQRLKESWAFWRDVRAPYDRRYGEYFCLRRGDLRPLTSAAFDRGTAEVWLTVKQLGPLPPPQNFEIGN